ncbi:MAG: exo-alpha-sialidase [Spirochaetes bacterium]|nr:exo-alpha-sialidase [Spirochaetota bacterium]
MSPSILPPDWNPKTAGDRALATMIRATPPQVKGAHDAAFALAGGKAYVVAEMNDVRSGENPAWPFIYCALTVVDLTTMEVERFLPFARSLQVFENETLPEGACFVPRILQKDPRTLRCFFASEAPGKRQAQTYYLDFDLGTGAFSRTIHRAKIRTAAGTFDMQPRFFHEDAARAGFPLPPVDYGLYLFDAFKRWEGKTYVALNNYPGGQNALATLNEAMDTFEVVGHYNDPCAPKMTESSVNRLPDGSFLAICRQEGGTNNYLFAESPDGKVWGRGAPRAQVPNGTHSKPTFDKFGDTYYLGWQEATRIDGAARSVFNLDVSKDGEHWERKVRFESADSFHYPSFLEQGGSIYFTATQGEDPRVPWGNQGRIMIGRLSGLLESGSQASIPGAPMT